MATAEELLNDIIGEEESKVITVDMDTRTILVPKTVKNIGVESDDEVLRLDFSMPRFYGDIDLFTFRKQINYKNAKGNGDVYHITDAVVEGENIVFTWLVGRNATAFEGNMQFNICFKTYDKIDNTIVLEEFNTTPVTMPVLKGLETSEAVVQKHADILVQWENQLFGVGDTVEAQVKANLEAKGAMVLESIPEDYQTLFNRSNESLRTRANAIVETVEGVSVEATDASNDYLRGLRVFGKSIQDGTPSPDNPVDIQSIAEKGKVKVAISGKNMLDLNSTSEPVIGESSYIENGNVYILYQSANALSGIAFKNIPVTPNDKYTFSYDWVGGDRIVVRFYDDLGNNVSEGVDTGFGIYNASYEGRYSPVTENGVVIEIPSNVTSIDIYFVRLNTVSAGNYNIYSNIQLERGDKKTAYEPYTGSVVTVDIPETGLAGLSNGQTWNRDEIDFERGVYIQRVLVKQFTDFSSAVVTEPINGYTEGYIKAGKVIISRYGLCDKFPYISSGNVLRFATDSVLVYFTLPGELSETEWKNQMNAITPTVYLPLETPIEIPLSEANLMTYHNARTVYPYTMATNDTGTDMELTYNADTKSYFNNSRGASDEQVDASVRAYADEKGLSVPSDTHIENIVATYITNNPTEALTDAEIDTLSSMLK